jgi:hypothetical protein
MTGVPEQARGTATVSMMTGLGYTVIYLIAESVQPLALVYTYTTYCTPGPSVGG